MPTATAEDIIQMMMDKHESLMRYEEELKRREKETLEELKLIDHQIGMLRGLIRSAGGKVEGI